MLTIGADVVPPQQLADAEGGGGDKARQSDGEFADVGRVEAVHVLFGVNRLDHLLCVDMLRQWQLDDEAVEVVVRIELSDFLEQLLLRDVCLEAQGLAADPARLAGDHLIVHVGLAATIVADEDGNQSGRLVSLGDHLLHLRLDLLSHLPIDLLAIEQCVGCFHNVV